MGWVEKDLGELPRERGSMVEQGGRSSPAKSGSAGQSGSHHPWPYEDPTLSHLVLRWHAEQLV